MILNRRQKVFHTVVSEGEGFSQSEAACLPADQSDGSFPLIDKI